jgi:hypothetical protein
MMVGGLVGIGIEPNEAVALFLLAPPHSICSTVTLNNHAFDSVGIAPYPHLPPTRFHFERWLSAEVSFPHSQ